MRTIQIWSEIWSALRGSPTGFMYAFLRRASERISRPIVSWPVYPDSGLCNGRLPIAACRIKTWKSPKFIHLSMSSSR